MNNIAQLIVLKSNGDSEIGQLAFFETHRDIPFEIKRIYYTFNVPKGTQRGMHAHKELHQALWCPVGTIDFVLDDGHKVEKYTLDSPLKLLIIKPGTWRDIFFRDQNSVLCVAVSEHYDEDDYVRNYDEFKNLVKQGFWDQK